MNRANDKPLRVGLTGGIASGKSTVADMFAELGVPVIDTDVIAREVVQPGEPALDEIREAFGDQVIGPDGNLDRAAMRMIVFADESARHELEKILHPRIRNTAMQQADRARGDYQLIVVPLLVESPLRSFVDRVLVVDCDEQTQIGRLLARDAETEQQARRMLAAQASREDRLAIADDIIYNDGDLQKTRDQALILHRNYLQWASEREI
ncbi:MAG: dephospho-CoA kinase [Woeseiaceae bacterium]